MNVWLVDIFVLKLLHTWFCGCCYLTRFSTFLYKVALLCHGYSICRIHISTSIFIHMYVVATCMKIFHVKGRTKKKALVTMLALVGVNMGVPVSDPYNGNGLSDGYANLLGCSNNNR